MRVGGSSVWFSGLHQPAAGGGGRRGLCDGGAPPGSRPGQPGGGAEGGAAEVGSPRSSGAAGPDAAAGRQIHPAGPERTETQVSVCCQTFVFERTRLGFRRGK